MTFKVGDRVRLNSNGEEGVVSRKRKKGVTVWIFWDSTGREAWVWEDQISKIENSKTTAINPNHYVFPGGVEVRQISAHLTSFGGQAVQYVARATRLDGQNKGEAVEDLKKAIKFLQWEIERIEQ